jgi:hypothetical protein
MYKTVSYARAELFERVWTTSLLQLAKEIGVSDVALGKACRSADIPLPGRGYWAKNPKQRHRPSLPENHDPYYDTLSFRVLDPVAIPAKVDLPPGVDAEPDKSGTTAERIGVPATLEAPHRLVARAVKLARSAKQLRDG